MNKKPKTGRKNLIREFVGLRKKTGKLPPLSAAEEKVIEGELFSSSVYASAKLEGSKLTREDVKNIIAADA